VSPILVRPVREQLEHDRVIRLLQAKYKRKYDVGINPGEQQLTSAGTGPGALYPDLVLHSSKGRRLEGVVEVETTESVNYLEAMAQWVALGRIRAAFHLYVPTFSIDPARRMCQDMNVGIAELWAYHQLGDQVRFTLVQKFPAAGRRAGTSATTGARKKPGSPARTAPARKGAAKAKKAASVAKKTAKKAAAARKATAKKKTAGRKK
jgi:hypothetical protein